jgi:hypothetical protein
MPGQKRVFALDVRASTSCFRGRREDVDGRDKPGHDGADIFEPAGKSFF